MAMADVVSGSWLYSLQVVIPLVTGLVTGLLGPLIVAFFLPRNNLQRRQLVSDIRVKRLDAVEKALSLAAKAKAEFGIEVTIRDVQRELQNIVHEFSPRAVLSREVLEEWISKTYRQRQLFHPSFTVPVEEARTFRGITNIMIAYGVCGLGLMHERPANPDLVYETGTPV